MVLGFKPLTNDDLLHGPVQLARVITSISYVMGFY